MSFNIYILLEMIFIARVCFFNINCDKIHHIPKSSSGSAINNNLEILKKTGGGERSAHYRDCDHKLKVYLNL